MIEDTVMCCDVPAAFWGPETTRLWVSWFEVGGPFGGRLAAQRCSHQAW